MTECSMKSCGNTTTNSSYKEDGISFHRFPKCQKTKQKWIEATRRDDDWSPTNESVICSIHFTEDDFQVMKNRRRLRDSSVPTLNLPLLLSMDSSLRDYVIAEYRQKLLENYTRSSTLLEKNTAANGSNNKKESDTKEIVAKNKKKKSKKPFNILDRKYRLGAGRSMKFIQLLANEKMKRKMMKKKEMKKLKRR